MQHMSYDFEKYEDDKLMKPRDAAWQNWAKWEAIGDKVQGYIRDVFYRPQEGEFREQRVLTLQQKDGALINVPIKAIPFILEKTDNLRLGDPVTLVFEQELPPKKKGYKKAKVITPYGKNLPENADNPTVKELYEQSVKEGGYTVEPSESEKESETTFEEIPDKDDKNF